MKKKSLQLAKLTINKNKINSIENFKGGILPYIASDYHFCHRTIAIQKDDILLGSIRCLVDGIYIDTMRVINHMPTEIVC